MEITKERCEAGLGVGVGLMSLGFLAGRRVVILGGTLCAISVLCRFVLSPRPEPHREKPQREKLPNKRGETFEEWAERLQKRPTRRLRYAEQRIRELRKGGHLQSPTKPYLNSKK